jgi:LPS sulfotransferase NodH
MRPHTSYLICATPRSGSSLLCEALRNTGKAGRPEEFFLPRNEPVWQGRWNTSTYAEYVAEAIKQGTTPNGVFGAKVMWGYFDDFASKLRQLAGFEVSSNHALMTSIFPNLHYIWIRRRDRVRQAISHAKARQTNIWRLETEVGRWQASPLPTRLVGADLASALLSRDEPTFFFEQIDFMVREIEAHEAAWQRYFAESGIQPLVVVYEDLVLKYEETAIQILNYLNIPTYDHIEFAPRRLRQQADEQTEQWVQRYYRIKARWRGYRIVSLANDLLQAVLRFPRLGALIVRKMLGA